MLLSSPAEPTKRGPIQTPPEPGPNSRNHSFGEARSRIGPAAVRDDKNARASRSPQPDRLSLPLHPGLDVGERPAGEVGEVARLLLVAHAQRGAVLVASL